MGVQRIRYLGVIYHGAETRYLGAVTYTTSKNSKNDIKSFRDLNVKLYKTKKIGPGAQAPGPSPGGQVVKLPAVQLQGSKRVATLLLLLACVADLLQLCNCNAGAALLPVLIVSWLLIAMPSWQSAAAADL